MDWICGLEVGSIRRIQGIGYGVLEFLGVGTTFDIFQNIHILYLQYGVLTSSGYGVLIFFPLWSLKMFPEIEFKEPYTPSYDPPGIVYEDLDKQKRVLRADELYKFSDGTLKSVRDEIHHRVLEFRLDYNKEMPKRKWMAVDRKRLSLMIELIDKQLREREIIRNLKRLVGARELEMDYKLITLTV
ncbi:hypothetical protein Tco_1429356 [Tanacetum coccineum]